MDRSCEGCIYLIHSTATYCDYHTLDFTRNEDLKISKCEQFKEKVEDGKD